MTVLYMYIMLAVPEQLYMYIIYNAGCTCTIDVRCSPDLLTRCRFRDCIVVYVMLAVPVQWMSAVAL